MITLDNPLVLTLDDALRENRVPCPGTAGWPVWP